MLELLKFFWLVIRVYGIHTFQAPYPGGIHHLKSPIRMQAPVGKRMAAKCFVIRRTKEMRVRK